MFITSALRKEFGGPPVAVVGASTSLSALGNEVTVMVFGQTSQSIKENLEFYSELKQHNVKVIVLKAMRTSIYGGTGNLRDLGKLISEVGKVDIISAHAIYNLQNILIYPIAKILRKPYAVMPHGSLTRYQSNIHICRKRIVDQYFRHIFLRDADSIFVATEVEKSELNARLQKKTCVVGLGINAVQEEEEPKGDTTNKDYRFLYMGRIATKKRLDIAIESFALLVKQSTRGFKLIVCGSGDSQYVQTMYELAQKLGVSELVDFRGWVEAEEKRLQK